MDGIAVISSNLIDINGEIINSGDTIMCEGETYIVMSVNKDDIGWIGYPCGNNPNTDVINLSTLNMNIKKI